MRTVAILVAAFLCGCVSTKKQVTKVQPGDCLLIKFTAISPPDLRSEVDATGAITLPLVGRHQVSGKTLDQVRQELENVYRRSWPPDQKIEVSDCP